MQTVGYDGWQFPLGGGGGPAGGGGGAGARPARRPCEAHDRVQLDAVRSDAGLAMDLVEEADAGDRRRAGEPREGSRGRAARRDERLPSPAHLRPRYRRCPCRAGRGRELRDHRRPAVARIGDHEMDVAVVFELHLEQGCPHAERRPLHASQSPQADVAGDLLLAQGPDRRRGRRKTEPAPGRIGERLHGPALDTAADLLRARSSRLRGSDPRPREGDDRQAEEKSSQITPHCDPHAPLPRAAARPSWTRLVLRGVSRATGGGAIAHSEQLARRFGL